ncbi:unnamed protein product, partial [Adineta steineri]
MNEHLSDQKKFLPPPPVQLPPIQPPPIQPPPVQPPPVLPQSTVPSIPLQQPEIELNSDLTLSFSTVTTSQTRMIAHIPKKRSVFQKPTFLSTQNSTQKPLSKRFTVPMKINNITKPLFKKTTLKVDGSPRDDLIDQILEIAKPPEKPIAKSALSKQ